MKLEEILGGMGHIEVKRTVEWIEDFFFYWPQMTQVIERKCQACEHCLRRKAKVQKAIKLVNIQAFAPHDVVCIVFLTLELMHLIPGIFE